MASQIYQIVKLPLKDEASVKTVLEKFKVITKYVKENEPGVISYDVLTKGNEILVFERYDSKESLKSHGKIPPLKDLQAVLPGALAGKPSMEKWSLSSTGSKL